MDLLWSFGLSHRYPLTKFFPLDSICKGEELDNSPNSLYWIFSLRIKSRTLWIFNLLLFKELFMVVTITFQLSNRKDKSINVCISSSNSVPTELNWFGIILSSLRCCVDMSSVIYKLNNHHIKWTLFEVDEFSCIQERVTIRLAMVDNIRWTIQRVCLSRRAQFSSLIPFIFVL